MGRAMVVINGKKRYGACIGGMVSVIGGCVRLVPATFEWAEHIDMERAERSFTNAKATLADKNASDAQLRLAEARLRRALVRKGVGSAQ
jgi:F-type H+-transporting ATPase subunit epsilon